MEHIIFNNEIALKTEFDGYYATVSGKIITVKVKGGCGKLDFNYPREHCYKVDKDGYLEVCISCNGKHIYRRVHRLVWETINGKIENNLTIDHINKNKQDNRLENLRLLTRENNARIAKIGIKNPTRFRYKVFEYTTSSMLIFIGILDRKEIENRYNLPSKIWYKNGNKFKINNVLIEKV